MKNIDDFQLLWNGFLAQQCRERAETQMTLGKLIDALKTMPGDVEIVKLYNPHSYRGYYSDLAFSLADNESMTALQLLTLCQNCMGHIFEGYKGGEYVMGALTPIWIADYGCYGVKVIAIGKDGFIKTAKDED